uniref:Uncharacterized protein n=1 Tax=Candidatus Kentrum sp. SD TaxID=2126332 RepID=A0A451BJC4_9GAMM|nr:MAG: hypothetical protein BECKSD772D_GA0070982_101223 [Candidatus Kentron sp. SD]
MILLPKKSWSGKPFTLPGARSVFYDLVVFGIQTMYRKNKNLARLRLRPTMHDSALVKCSENLIHL